MKTIRDLRNCQFNAFFFVVLLLGPFYSGLAWGSPPTTLEARINQILKEQHLDLSPHSIEIVSLPDKKTLYQSHKDLALNPASNAKIVTAATALSTLGPDFTFKTEFYSDKKMGRDGVIGPLWIKGFGDPVLTSEEVEAVAHQLAAAGLRTINGPVYVDDSYFDHYHLTTYLSDVGEKVYSIVTGPLSFNFNTLTVHARPGRQIGDQPILTFEPPSLHLIVQNEARTSSGGLAGLAAEMLHENEIRITGNIPRRVRGYRFRIGIPDPATFTGEAVLAALAKEGVSIPATIRREAVPARAFPFLTHSSPPLKEVLKGLGKFSNNFTAEQLVKSMSAVRFGPPGSTSRGLDLMKAHLRALGIPSDEFVLDNGSGLSKLTRLSASHLTRTLLDLYDSPWREDFIQILSIGGVDGTLRKRMRRSPLRGHVYAKTGTLNQVSSLSGYLMDGRQTVAFAFIFNDFPSSMNGLYRTEEKILESVWSTTHH